MQTQTQPTSVPVLTATGQFICTVADNLSAGAVMERVGAASIMYSNKFGPSAWVIRRMNPTRSAD